MRATRSRLPAEPAVVVVGGGTGLSSMLRGLKFHTRDITAIVTVADDGGGSGVLREELGMPPPGDIRNCIEALANTEPTMQALLGYRFREGSLRGQSLGNLFLAALNDMSPSFDEAVSKLCQVLAVTGRVLPVTNENIQLVAEFDDGTVRLGESKIADHKKASDRQITRVRLIPEAPPALQSSLEAIARADMIVLGPGSLYTSIIPNLLTAGIADAIYNADALKICVLNIMTQNGETEGYAASGHIKALFSHSRPGLFQYCLANSSDIPQEILAPYRAEGAEPTRLDVENIRALGVELLRAPLASWENGPVRHSPTALAAELMRLFREHAPTRVYS